jgi:hypothetical protein
LGCVGNEELIVCQGDGQKNRYGWLILFVFQWSLIPRRHQAAKYAWRSLYVRSLSCHICCNVAVVSSEGQSRLYSQWVLISFDGFGSIPWQSVWFLSDGSFSFTFFFSDFQLSRPEHHWGDLSCRNAHLNC